MTNSANYKRLDPQIGAGANYITDPAGVYPHYIGKTAKISQENTDCGRDHDFEEFATRPTDRRVPGVTVLKSIVARFQPFNGEADRAESGVKPAIEQARWIRDEER